MSILAYACGNEELCQAAQIRRIAGGTYQAFVLERPAPGKPLEPVNVQVAPFEMAENPVTNQEFLAFVTKAKKWQRGAATLLFADRNYLRHWQADLTLGGSAPPGAPVTNVSWFAARAFCESEGKRLPTIDEWEFAARPEAYGKKRDVVLAKILEWYGQPAGEQGTHHWDKTSMCTVDGVCGLHGVVWEWVEDFGSVISSDENRTNASPDSGMFCGAGAVGAMDPNNYAAFMRYAFRSSLKGGYTIGHLGFRCVR